MQSLLVSEISSDLLANDGLLLVVGDREPDTETVSSTQPGPAAMTTGARETPTRVRSATPSPAQCGPRGVTGARALSHAAAASSCEAESVSSLSRGRRGVRASPPSPGSATPTSALSGQTSLTGQNARLGRFTFVHRNGVITY